MFDASIYRLRLHHVLALCCIGLLLLGVLMVQSAAMNVNGETGWQWSERGARHMVYAMVAMVAFFMIGHVDTSVIERRGSTLARTPLVWMVTSAAFLCLIVLIPHVGIEVNGARRWLPLGFLQVQPSDLAKWAVVLLTAWWFTHRPVNVDRLSGLLLTLIPMGLFCLLIVIQDFGTAALVGLVTVMMLVVARVKWWHLAMVIPPALGAAVWFIAHKEYRLKRLMAFTDPWAAPQGEGYHMIQSLLSFSTGGSLGRGLGNGIQKLGYLPEDTTDFIFSVICEELGLFGALLTVMLYAGIVYVAYRAMRMNKGNTFARLLAFGIGAMVGTQAMINIAVATVSVPTKGLSLPLISAGGSGLIVTCAALGLLYNLARRAEASAEDELLLILDGMEMPEPHATTEFKIAA